jgi:magnesium chelatase family protein
MSGDSTGEKSDTVRARVETCRQVQRRRFGDRHHIGCNARMAPRDLKEFCKLDDAGQELLKMAMTELNLSARAYDRILKVARTIADLDSSEHIQANHVGEAIQYRSLDRQLWI